MLPPELVARGQHVMTVCNACRYCEAYCPVFPAMEDRLTFTPASLAYLANLCHGCGECLYACQYAPPHEFGINVPRTLGEIRLASYEAYCWPPAVGAAFRRQPLVTALAIAAGFILLVLLAQMPAAPLTSADFYQVVPHGVMVALFSAEALFIVVALMIGGTRSWRDFRDQDERVVRLKPDATPAQKPDSTSPAYRVSGTVVASGPPPRVAFRTVVVSGFSRTFSRGLLDALTLKHLHGAGQDCSDAEETRAPWRRWFHHCTFYGFALCFASTSVAALYHLVFDWRAPYAYASVPVVLGTAGGVGLIVGPAGLLALRARRDRSLTDASQDALDVSFNAMLLLTSGTGLGLLALRDTTSMPALLIFHLACVFALFLVLPYGKFVHGIYRLVALIEFANETSKSEV